MSKQIQDYTQLLRLIALSKLKSLFIYLSDEQDEGCRPFYFLQSIYLSPLDSAVVVEGSILNTGMWQTSLLLVLDQIT